MFDEYNSASGCTQDIFSMLRWNISFSERLVSIVNIIRTLCLICLFGGIGISSVIVGSLYDCDDEDAFITTMNYLLISGVISIVNAICACLMYVYTIKEEARLARRQMARRVSISSMDDWVYDFARNRRVSHNRRCCSCWILWEISWCVAGIILWYEVSANCQNSLIGKMVFVNIIFKLLFIGSGIVFVAFSTMLNVPPIRESPMRFDQQVIGK